MREDVDKLFEFLHKIRKLLSKAGSDYPACQIYQDCIAHFVFNNRQLGGPIIELGCHRGGLTAQLAFMAKIIDTHLFVIDPSQELLANALSINEKLNLNTHTSYHKGTLETFDREIDLAQKPLLLAINGEHGVFEQFQSVHKLSRIPYAVAVHRSAPEISDSQESLLDRAVFEHFGKTVNLARIGREASQCGHDRKDGAFLNEEEHKDPHVSEGIIFVPTGERLPDSLKTADPSIRNYPRDAPVGPEARKTHRKRCETGFYDGYMKGVGLDVGFSGHFKGVTPILPGAVGVDLDYPGYDGKTLPFPDNSQDYVFTSHVLEHIPDYRHAIRDWHRVVKSGGHIVIIVPHQFLYEKRTCLPSAWNRDHKRFYTPGSLLGEIEESLSPNTYRIVHLRENDDGFEYDVPPENHSVGCYEIECVIRKLDAPAWRLLQA